MLIVKRSPKNPIIMPTRGRAYEALGAFNPSVVAKDGVRHLFYRALSEPDALRTPDRGFSTIGYAASSDGTLFTERRQVISPTESWEHYGCEDPRATYFEGKWYVFYTALGGYPFSADNIKVAVAVGDSPETLTEKHLVTPFNAKAATLFPERVDGDAVLLLTAHTDYTHDHPRPTIAVARAKRIEDFWSENFWKKWHDDLASHALPNVRRADTEHMEIAASPVRISQGWLLVYSHIQDYYDEAKRIFGVEALVLDADDPQSILARTEGAFMVPEEAFERYGIVQNVVFPTGAVVEDSRLDIYYGAADMTCALASLSLPDLLDSMSKEARLAFLARAKENPILEPIAEHDWESRAVFNAAAVDLDGSVHLLYRAMGNDNTSVMGYARLEDGLHVVERLAEPVYVPRREFEAKRGKPDGNSGCEDPRLALINDDLHLCYTAYDGVHEPFGAYARIAKNDFLARRFDWSEPMPLTPGGISDKDICLFPEKMNGRYVIVHRLDPNICLDEVEELPPSASVNRCIELMGPRLGMWDDRKIGAAGPPLPVPEGWLFIYHGVGSDGVYRLGAALLDATGTSVLARTAAPIFEPVLDWETIGQVGNVVFSCGAVVRGDTLFIYYGGADTAIGVATMQLSTLMRKLLPDL
ncbi:MAG TPA: hypothetical protein VFY28_01560 [Candidatus Paceibacterota bacterium]|nr:hypothetical protein [Candidatus Paceibacterota bacterium]